MERITVSALNGLIKHIIDNSALLGTFYVTGEVSNYRPNHTGHVYFSLKDEKLDPITIGKQGIYLTEMRLGFWNWK